MRHAVFKETLLIVPKLSAEALSAMEKALTSRFGKIAKKFGKGLVASLAGGGIAGIALGLIDKLLNPLKEVQEGIDRVLEQGDDLVTHAKQFGTTAGKLFRLQQLAKSTGLDEGSLSVLIEKFQTAVAQAVQDPSKDTSVRQFIGQKDTAEAFFQFIQSLQKMTKTQQVLVQNEVFGEKQILKMADFLQTDFVKQAQLVGGPTSAQLTPGIEKLGELNDLKDALTAKRTLNDTLKKSREINESMIKEQDQAAQRNLDAENKKIQSYEALAALSKTSDLILNSISAVATNFATFITKFTELSKNIDKLLNSRWIRGLIGKGN